MRIRRLIAAMSVVMPVACSSGTGVSVDNVMGSGGESHRAVELCDSKGRDVADQIGDVTSRAAVFAAEADEVAEWQRARHGAAGLDQGSDWADETGLVALCYFDATNISAPGGPPPAEGEIRPPYDQLLVLVGEHGHVEPYMARRNSQGREYERPESAKRVDG
jgi:hypothetical protein